MTGLRLPRLPERTPVKLTLHLAPDLHAALERYATLYEESYGHAEPLAELIPAMLADYLDGDRAFARRRKSS